MGDIVKRFAKVQIDKHPQSFPHLLGRSPSLEGDQVCQAGPAFPNPTLSVPDSLVVLYVQCDGNQDDLFHGLPWYRGQADSPVAPWFLRLNLL